MPRLYLTGAHFWGKLQHIGLVGEQKIKCRPIRTPKIDGIIVRGTICKLISSNRKFWKTSKLLSSNRGLNSKLMPIEKYKLVSEESESDRILNKNFTNITKSVKLKRSPYLTYCFQNHTSIFKIASIGNPKNDLVPKKIKFIPISRWSEKGILNLDIKKATRKRDIPENLLKKCISRHLLFLTNIISSCIEQSNFPVELKLANAIPIL